MPQPSWNEVRDRAVRFSRRWTPITGLERAEKQTFWNEFFDVFGIRRASVATFEENVRNLQGNMGAIDLLWRGKLLVEHKSRGGDLSVAASEAFEYIEDLTREGRSDEIPRFVIVSDFANFVLYDLEPDEQLELPLFAGLRYESHRFTLADFPRNLRAFAFMLGQTRVRLNPEDPANEKAYTRMCELHDSLADGGFSGHELERLLCRVLFCLFAEDTGIFAPDAFTQFIRTETRTDGSDLGARLNELFDWLNNPQADGYFPDTDWRYSFRYVNGGLFAERLGFPAFTKAMRDALLFCCDFEWARISPAVFGSLFQGVMDNRARRQQGAHYTSEPDIMKVIRSLFLDDLRAEWERVKVDRSTRRRLALEGFHQKLRSLQFLDPACGCGNFLVLTYRELRALEIEVVRELAAGSGGQNLLPIVNVDQFHGIELSEWPVRIAEVAMWLMDHQMNQEASAVFGQPIDRLPLTSAPHLVHKNALGIDWNEVLPKEKCSYVLGNPPFGGSKLLTPDQKIDVATVFPRHPQAGVIDYVGCWYRKAVDYCEGQQIRCAFVSTNSITQGEQVAALWPMLFERGLVIHFAHRTFQWMSEARGRAHVHVVIIGFGLCDRSPKTLFEYPQLSGAPVATRVSRINAYLIEGPIICIPPRGSPVCTVPAMVNGSVPADGGHLLIDNVHEFLAEEPNAAPWVRPYLGADGLINGSERHCLWLKDCPPNTIRSMRSVVERLEKVRAVRSASP